MADSFRNNAYQHGVVAYVEARGMACTRHHDALSREHSVHTRCKACVLLASLRLACRECMRWHRWSRDATVTLWSRKRDETVCAILGLWITVPQGSEQPTVRARRLPVLPLPRTPPARPSAAAHGRPAREEVRLPDLPPFRLDPSNQCLWRRQETAQDERILLPPKAFAVLCYLVEHAGRLVTQEELLEAVWPET